MGENADPEKNKLARTLGMQVYMVFGIIGLTTLAIFVINNLRIFGWSEINRYEVSSSDFSALFDVSRMILLVALTAFIIQGIIAIFSNRDFSHRLYDCFNWNHNWCYYVYRSTRVYL